MDRATVKVSMKVSRVHRGMAGTPFYTLFENTLTIRVGVKIRLCNWVMGRARARDRDRDRDRASARKGQRWG